jgi:lysophospholipid acyltransferase (LPLAT)-like uncharacterized protein
VAEDPEKLYKFAPLDQYTARERLAIRAADLLFYSAIKLFGSLARFEVRGYENFEQIAAAGKQPIYSFWHDRIFLGTYYFRDRGIVVLTSQSFDGEYIARFIQRLGYGAIRGSSSRGAVRAFVEMIRTMRAGHSMAFTVDGPRGPRYQVKPGPVTLAKKTGNPMIPFVFEPKRYLTINSWDKMQIPLPFTKALLLIGEPIYVPADADDNVISEKLAELQASLDELNQRAAEWRVKG